MQTVVASRVEHDDADASAAGHGVCTETDRLLVGGRGLDTPLTVCLDRHTGASAAASIMFSRILGLGELTGDAKN